MNNRENQFPANPPTGKFRWKALYAIGAALVLLGLYCTILLDLNLRSGFESFGSALNQAQVNIGSLHTRLFKGELTIENLEITNDREPTRNLIQIDKIAINVVLEPLLRRKLIVHQINISGVHYNTERKVPGNLPADDISRLGPPLMERVATGFYSQVRGELGENPLKTLGALLTGVDMGTKVAMSKNELQSIRTIATLRQRIDATETNWKDLIARMPSADSIISAQDTMKELKKAQSEHAIADAEVTGKLHAINDKLLGQKADSSAAWATIVEQSRGVQTDFERMGVLLDQDVRMLKSRLKLPRLDYDDLTSALFGPVMLGYLERATYWTDLSRRRMPVASQVGQVTVVPQPGTGGGVNYHFSKRAAYPAFLIYQVQIHSKSTVTDPTLVDVDGSIKGITSDPWVYSEPLALSLTVDYPTKQVSKAHLEGTIDHTGTVPREELTFTAASLPITGLPINDAGDVQLTLSRGTAAVKAVMALQDSDLNASINANVTDARFQINSRFKEIQTVIENSVASAPSFEITGKLAGKLDALAYSSSSEVGRKLASDLRYEFKHQIGAIEDDLRKNILDEIYPQREALVTRFTEAREKVFMSAQSRIKSIQDLLGLTDRELARLEPSQSPTAKRQRKARVTN
jgi:uncharacterized protein (TIGR03545 family)